MRGFEMAVATGVMLGLSPGCDEAPIPVDGSAVAIDGSADAHADSSVWDSYVICEGCNPVAQVGCAPFQKCSINWSHLDLPCGANDCLPDTGRGAPGEACSVDAETSTDDCAMGLLCYLPGEPAPVCREICSSFPDTCSEGTCVVFEQFGIDTVGVCLPP